MEITISDPSLVQEVSCFSLEKHPGEYQTWPVKSHLLMEGVLTELEIPGYVLECQFATPSSYLLISDYDCPYEEAVNFTLISKDLRFVLATRCVGHMYTTFWLQTVTWADDRHFRVTFARYEYEWLFTIRRFGIPFIYPQLGKSWRKLPASGLPEIENR